MITKKPPKSSQFKTIIQLAVCCRCDKVDITPYVWLEHPIDLLWFAEGCGYDDIVRLVNFY